MHENDKIDVSQFVTLVDKIVELLDLKGSLKRIEASLKKIADGGGMTAAEEEVVSKELDKLNETLAGQPAGKEK